MGFVQGALTLENERATYVAARKQVQIVEPDICVAKLHSEGFEY